MRSQTNDPLESVLTAYSATSKSVAALWDWRDRLGSWPTYCAATAAALACATSASAGIIYSGPLNVTVSVPASAPFGHASALGLARAALGSIGLYLSHSGPSRGRAWLGFREAGVQQNGTGGVKRLPLGAVVSGSYFSGVSHRLAFKLPGGPERGDWAGPAVTGFAGASFFGGVTNTGTGTLYRFFSIVDNGWLRIRVRDLNNDGVPDTVTLIDYAYNNLGRYRGIYPGIAAIRAGVGVPGPEPGSASMMLLAAGAAGVVAWKRRRKAA